MNENKVRKMILMVMFAAIILGIVVHTRFSAPDTKSKLSKEVYTGRELANTAVRGNEKGEYSDYEVTVFSEKVERAAAVMSDLEADEAEAREALEEIRAAIKTFRSAENRNCVSADEIEKLIENGESRECKSAAGSSLKLIWNLDGSILTEAEAVNLEAGEDGIYTEQLREQIGLSYDKTGAVYFSLRQNGPFPLGIELSLLDSFENGGEYMLVYYDGGTDGLSETPVTAGEGGRLTFSPDQGGDYCILKSGGSTAETETEQTVSEAEQTEEALDEETETEKFAAGAGLTGEEEGNSESDGNSDDGQEETVDSYGRDSTAVSGGDGQSGKAAADNTKENNSKNERENGGKKNEKEVELDLNAGETKKEETQKQETEKKETEGTQTAGSETTPATDTPPATEAVKRVCTITIRCETILKNMPQLREGLAGYVPSNGIILGTTKVELYEGETVFDVLKRVTRAAGLKLEFRNDGVHGAGYIVGINHLNEFDCGTGSGWMYTVNGWFPNYGCSKYVLQNGDAIQWIYTCDLGRDIGGNFWE